MRLLRDLDHLQEAGRSLLEDLDHERVVDHVVKRLLRDTRADVVALYPYRQKLDQFDQPRLAGRFLGGEEPLRTSWRPDSLPAALVRQADPIFAGEADRLVERLGGGSDRTRPFHQREEVVSVAALPLRVSGEAVGALFVNFRKRQPFDDAQKLLIEGLAVYAAFAIKNARKLGEKSARHRQEYAVLKHIDEELEKTNDLDVILQKILDHANGLVEAEAAAILLVRSEETGESHRSWLEVASATGRHAEDLRGRAILVDRGLVGWVFQNQKSRLVDDIEQEDLVPDHRRGTRSELDVPLIIDEEGTQKVIGVINFENPSQNFFTKEDQLFVERLASHVVSAVGKAHAYEDARRESARRQILFELSQAIIGELEHDQLLVLLVEKAKELTGADSGALALYDPAHDRLEAYWFEGPGPGLPRRTPLTAGLVVWVARNYRQTPLVNCNPQEAPWCEHYMELTPSIRSELDIALYDHERLWGVLNVESRRRDHFGDHDVRLIRSLADLAVIALRNAERYRAAKEGRARMEAVQKLSQQIIRQTTSVDDVMAAVTHHALVLTGSHRADVDFVIDGKLTPKDCYYRAPESQDLLDISQRDLRRLANGIIDHVGKTREPYRTGDAQNDPHYKGGPEIRSELAVPLLRGEQKKLIGVLNVESQDSEAFGEEHKELLMLFADVAVIAIEDTRHRERIDALIELGHELGKLRDGSDLAKACDLVTRKAAQMLHCLAITRIHDPQARQLVRVKAMEADGNIRHFEEPFDAMGENEGFNGVVFRSRKTEIWKPGNPDVKLSDPETRSIVIAPIQISREFYFGNLGFSHHEASYFEDDDVKLIQELARQLATTYHRLQGVQHQHELKDRERQAEIMSSFGAVSYDFVHRLGNDLGLIRSYVDLLKEGLEREKVAISELEYFDRIVDDVQRVLDFSTRLKPHMRQFETGESTIVSVQMLWDGVRETFRHQEELEFADVRGVAPIYGVTGQILDILRNLVTNALEALPEEGGRIMLDARNGDAESFVELQVIDTGRGISSENQAKIFKFLWSSKKGSGFGLWSARRLAEFNGGKLSVTSELGRGSTFTLTLPRADKRVEALYEAAG